MNRIVLEIYMYTNYKTNINVQYTIYIDKLAARR